MANRGLPTTNYGPTPSKTMNKDSILVNLSDRAVKNKIMSEIGRLTGLYELTLKPRKRTRSLDQNAYYWIAVVSPFTNWLKENYGDSRIDKEQAHEMLKAKVLGLQEKQIKDEKVILIPRSRTLSVEEFSEYIEKCAAWLAEFCEIIVIPSEDFYEAETLGRKKGKGLVADNK